MKTLRALCLVSMLTLTGCAGQKTQPEPSVKVVHEAVPQTVYQPPNPEPLQLENVRWFVITDENLAQQRAQITRLSASGFVVFAISARDYENLSGNLQELKRYIAQQRAIIEYYQTVTRTEESWLERNDKKREAQRQQFQNQNK